MKLLSIAIPTWNRAEILRDSLNHLIPQIKDYNNEIELILSNNGSTDHTKNVIEEYILANPAIDILSNHNGSNLGYYENFKKCRQISSGENFWLLSDNDFVLDGVIKSIIEILQKLSGLAFIALKDRGNHYPLRPVIYRTSNVLSIDQAIKVVNTKVTLISSVIIHNNKVNDEYIFNRFNNNSFLGLALLVNSSNFQKNAIVVHGQSLMVSNKVKSSFNVFESWTEHICQVTDYMREVNFANDKTIDNFINTYLKNAVKWHYFNLKMKSDISGHYSKQIYRILKEYYSGFRSFRLHIRTIRFIPVKLLPLYRYSYKLLNKISYGYDMLFKKKYPS